MIKFEIPESCCECPFEYDVVDCKLYDKSLWNDSNNTEVDTLRERADYCKAVSVTVKEKGD